VHAYAHPAVRDALTEFFTQIFEADVIPVPGTSMLAFRFPDNSSYSVEFTTDALSDQQARRGAWLEVKTDEPENLKKRVLDAGAYRFGVSAGST
jgi:hypothetical protein